MGDHLGGILYVKHKLYNQLSANLKMVTKFIYTILLVKTGGNEIIH